MISPLDRFRGLLIPLAITCLPVPSIAGMTCEALAGLSLSDTVVITAQKMPAGPLKLPHAITARRCESSVNSQVGTPCVDVADNLPEFCRVALRVDPQIHIEVWLPAAVTWNGRFLGVGNGGYAGWVNYGDLAQALRAGFATASTDTGHPFYMESAFAIKTDGSLNDQLIGDFAWRSVHELALKAKSLIRAYYGVPTKYSYWNSCSTGGRQGLMAVQRFPEEYDGVLAGSPAINWGRLLPAQLWPQLVIRKEVGHPISDKKLERVTHDAIAACDRDDGVIDGVIGDPGNCKYDPSESICRDKRNPNACLTTGEANAIRRIWDGPRSERTGERLWFGYERGTNLTRLFGLQPEAISIDYFRSNIRQDPGFNWHTLEVNQFEQYIRDSYAHLNETLGTDDPDLRQWKERRGKLVIWHDEGDEGIPPGGTLNYFDRVLAANGGFEEVRKFVRLYMVPGSSHCGVSEAPWNDSRHLRYKLFDALVEWVEQGHVPESVVASRKTSDGALSTRPVCPYPTTAKWTGQGDPQRAENFRCIERAHRSEGFEVMNLGGT